MADFSWSEKAGRFRDESGRFVPEARVRGGVDATVDRVSTRLQNSAKGLRDGSVSIEAFRDELFRGVKDVHIASGLAAYGGREAMTPERWGYLGSRTRAQYGYARKFIASIVDGTQPLNGRLAVRAAMYAEAGRTTYEEVRAREAKRRGYTEERNILHSRESCSQCRALSGQGWVEIGKLPPIGTRECMSRCRCTIEYRNQRADAADDDSLLQLPQPEPTPEPETPPEPVVEPEPVPDTAPYTPPAETRAAMEEYATEHEANVEKARDAVNTAWDAQYDNIEALGKFLEANDVPPSDSRVRRLNRNIDRANKKLADAKEERDRLRDTLEDGIREKFIYRVGAKADPYVHYQDAATPESLKEWEEGAEAFRRIVGYGHDIDGKHVTIRQAPTDGYYSGTGRSYYQSDTVNMASGAGTRTIVHELGHWLEEEGGVHDATIAHLRERTSGESSEPLGSGYNDDEVTKPDEFYNRYMGKQYTDDFASELLSMAVEHLYVDPLDFARKDPVTFDWVMNMLRSRNRL